MKDHSRTSAGSRATRRTVGVRELKTHAARIVRRVRQERASYVVTHRGQAVGVILPVDLDATSAAGEDVEPAAAWTSFLDAGHRLERRFRPGESGVRILSAMRR